MKSEGDREGTPVDPQAGGAEAATGENPNANTHAEVAAQPPPLLVTSGEEADPQRLHATGGTAEPVSRAPSPMPRSAAPSTQGSPKAPLPFGLPTAKFGLRVKISEVCPDGEYRPMVLQSRHLWIASVIQDLLKAEVPEIYETVLMEESWAILFFGRRLLNEGVTLAEAEGVSAHLSAGWRTWIG